MLNGRTARLGDRARPGDQISIDGKPVAARAAGSQQARVLLYHKPVGEIVTRDDPEGRPTVFGRLPSLRNARWMAVGRLDLNTSGLLLFTDSGELANRLMHPRYGLRREYLARVQGRLTDEQVQQLRDGVRLDDGVARFDSVAPHASSDAANRWYRVSIGEGRNREVRRLFEAVGVRVGRLVRLRYGPLALPRELRPGHWQELNPDAVQSLLRAPGKGGRALPG